MGRNVFVSYKYWDNSVSQFDKEEETIVRDYVNVIKKKLDKSRDYYYRGEEDGNDLSELNYKSIEKIISNLIFHTSITMVLISPRMFENVSETEQWIPWEISYSLRNKYRFDGNSYMNALMAVVLPDENGKYNYALRISKEGVFVKEKAFFEIILANMFNRKNTDHYMDDYGNPKYVPYESYVVLAKWNDFYNNPDYYFKIALENRAECDQFYMRKRIDKNWIS